MTYVFENLEGFLNEDMGTLNIFQDSPKEWMDSFFKQQAATGRESVVSKIDNPTDYKTMLKIMKLAEFIMIKVDGKSKFMIEQESPNKFKMWDGDNVYSVYKKRRDEEQRKREEEYERRKKEISEGRRMGRHYSPEHGLVGSYSVQEICGKIKALLDKNNQVEVYAIYKDEGKLSKRTKRGEINTIEDPLQKQTWTRGLSNSQYKRSSIFNEKKKAKLDKLIDDEIDSFKTKIINNFDKAITEVIDNLRKGYDWYANSEDVGKKIVSGVDFSGIKRFAQAYKAVSSSGDPNEAAKKLKDLGFGPKNESILEWFVEDQDVDGDGKDEHPDNTDVIDPERLEDILELYDGDSEEFLEDLFKVIPEEELEKYLDEVESIKLVEEDPE